MEKSNKEIQMNNNNIGPSGKKRGSIGWLIFWVIFGGGFGGIIYAIIRDWSPKPKN